MILFNLLHQFTDLHFDTLDELRESEIQSAQARYFFFDSFKHPHEFQIMVKTQGLWDYKEFDLPKSGNNHAILNWVTLFNALPCSSIIQVI